MMVFIVFVLTVLGCITLYEAVFGGRTDVSERLSAEPDTVHGLKIGAPPAPFERLLRWTVRRMRVSQSKGAGEQKLPETLTYAGYRGLESVARFQLTRFAITGGVALFLL